MTFSDYNAFRGTCSFSGPNPVISNPESASLPKRCCNQGIFHCPVHTLVSASGTQSLCFPEPPEPLRFCERHLTKSVNYFRASVKDAIIRIFFLSRQNKPNSPVSLRSDIAGLERRRSNYEQQTYFNCGR